ncbi:MAG: sigma-70 family RNA polymerase sigma factor [Oscillospiraceae bacterium]|nr:sigma-70 family RNA polymerase sigma factor [Oscillospiraceae bacterium]
MLIYLSMLDTAEEKSKFEQLYNRYRFTMLHTANSILQDISLSEDAVHDAFIRIAKNMNKLGAVESMQTKGFVVIVVKNVALTMAKRRSSTFFMEDEAAFLNIPDNASEDIFSKAGFESIVSQIVSLPDIYKEVMYLYLVNEMKIKEISSLLRLPEETVKKRLQRGRKLLIANLQKEGIVYEK